MFSGIVEETAEVLRMVSTPGGTRLTVKSSLDHRETRIGDSICICGVCLTVVALERSELSFDVSSETLRRSTLGSLSGGDRVNLERSLKHGERMHGHLVFGHVDTVATLRAVEELNACKKLIFSVDPSIAVFLAEKGSVSLSGVSLTLAETGKDFFTVYAVAHTLHVTTLKDLRPGAQVNIEVDMLARYVYRILKQCAQQPASSSITEEFLSGHGYMKART